MPDAGARRGLLLAQALLVASVVLLCPGGEAAAMGSCAGSYAAAALGSLPRPLVVGIDVLDNSPRNLALADQFRAGLGASGIAVAGTATALLRLNPTYSSGPADAAAGRFSDFSDFNKGGVRRDYPEASEIGGGQVGPQTLILRVELRPSASQQVVWVASVQCTVQTRDTAELAFDLGTVIGPIIGKRSDRVRF